MPIQMRRSAPRIVTAGILLAALGFSLAVNLPGHLSYDSVIQLLEGRQGIYAGWHPPLMSWLLGAFDHIVPGAAQFVVFDTLLLFGSALSLLFLPGKISWIAPVAALLCIVTPQLLLYPGIVWKDVLFAVLAAAAFVCMVHVAARWQNKRLRYALIVLCCLFLAAAALARQNGAVVVPVATVAFGWIAMRHSSPVAGAAYGIAMFAAVALLGLAAGAALQSYVSGDQGPTAQFRLLQAYDIVGAMKSDPNLRIDSIAADDPEFARLLRTDGVALYSPQRNDTLGKSARLQSALNNANPGVIYVQWLDLVTQHTWLYLKVRAEVFRWVFLTPQLEVCVPFEVGVDGPPDVLNALQIGERMDARDQALEDYASIFVGSPVFSHLAAMLLALAELIVLLFRRRDSDIAIAAMLAAACIFTLSFFVISIACDYRYLYFLDIAALIALLYLARDTSIAQIATWRAKKNT